MGDADGNFAAGESKSRIIITGADPGFLLGGLHHKGMPINHVTNANKPHFFAEYQLY